MQRSRRADGWTDRLQDRYVVELRYTEPVLRRAVRVFVSRRLLRRGWLWLAAAGLLLTSLVLGWWTGPSFAAGWGLASLVFLAAFVAAVWRAHSTNTVGRYRVMDPRTARFTFDAAAMTVASTSGRARCPGRASPPFGRSTVHGVLFLAPNHYMTLPTADLCAEAKAFLRTMLPEASRG